MSGFQTILFEFNESNHLASLTDKKYLNKYCYLTFMKGVFLRHLNQKPEAIQCFEEVIKQ